MKKYKLLFLFLFSLLFYLIFYFALQNVYCDEIWLYGFSYNISRGMIIYRDFNVVSTPLYFLIVSLFIKLLGNYIIVMHLFNAILFAFMILMLFKIINWKVLILIPLFLIWVPNGYSFFSLFFLILIIYLINNNKDNDYIIPLLVGLCFITKQNIGVFLLLPCLFYSKNKIKSIIIFCLPVLLLSIYLLVNNAFFEFIDYCFLGMFEFGKKNLNYNIIFVLLSLINIFVLLVLLRKSKFSNKELFYILVFQLVVYPIFDIRHYLCAFFPVVYLCLKWLNNKYILIVLFFTILFLDIVFIFSSNLSFNLDSNILFLKKLDGTKLVSEKVISYVDGSEYFFSNSELAYFVKLYNGIPISQYDLLLSGNVGYNGMDKKLSALDEFCFNKKCYFFLIEYPPNDILGGQAEAFTNHIINNYYKKDSLLIFDIYTN